MEFIATNMAPIMFAGLIAFLLVGFPLAFSLGACGLFFGFIGIEMGILPEALMQALPLRIFGIMQNDTLLAIPFFTLMGLILERSGMAEDLLDTIGQVFGPVRGGLAFAVILVGALLAATTGVVAASVISMGLISLPIMLRYGYDRRIASGTIVASGTLAQIIPPSLVLIVLADQLGRSVGDMYKGAFVPGFMLVGFYVLLIVFLAIFKPKMVPALPPEARTFREPNGNSGYLSLLLLTIASTTIALIFADHYTTVHSWWKGEVVEHVAKDETIVVSLGAGVALAFVLALINKVTRLGLLSRLAERVTFVLVPPLLLIFLVLGTVFLGVATPTEGGAMGAMGALILALVRRRLSLHLLKQALNATTKLSCFVLFILIGATMFSLTFQGVDGPRWVEHLLSGLPGGTLGFLIVVNLMVFFLAFFLDYFELAFIVVPLVAPVADKLGIDLVWFGVLLAVNMQTSFMHPPFGFALFYLRSVAPDKEYTDKVTKKRIAPVTTGQIIMGALPFVGIQLLMIGLIIAFPGIISRDKPLVLDLEHVEINIPNADFGGAGGDPLNPDANPGSDPQFETPNFNDDAPLEVPKD
ncbi:C4-dicarboxylate ABC transporter [Hylemonella gracilis]|uniref:C4-dicarboxylate ABC transporter n=1 Tax=Hylemonella gracilis TaxID=80880 RepID=A0A4P6UPA6_9BURK|nr:TRAP transporter large permease subunit [Hylemonella gracilis]QBK06130.1 C4-dicarboxylate ABC transporter [Hylemonella gracilis]